MEGVTLRRVGDPVEAALTVVQERLSGSTAEAAAAFVRRFYANVAPEDLADRSPVDLYGAALAIRGFAETRTPGAPKIRAYNPRAAEEGWTAPHTVVEIVNDDMPFLVDSVAAELMRQGLTIHLIVHPVLAVERDPEGRLKRIAPGAPARESLMHIEIDARSDPADLEAIAAGIRTVLDDVRAAVHDWKPMLRRLAAAAADVAALPDTDEEAAFLHWLEAGNFTFLAYGEFGPEGLIPGTGLGLLRTGRVLEPPAAADPPPVAVTKTATRATVHRAAHMDRISARRSAGGERRFLGLFTSRVFTTSPATIPLARRKTAAVIARAGLPPGGHAEKALLHMLETFPRDELLQADENDLYRIAVGMMQLQERRRIALFDRRDAAGRIAVMLVCVPRDRYDSALLARFAAILEAALDGEVVADSAQVDDDPLARLRFTLRARGPALAPYDPDELERLIVEAAREWPDGLRDALVARQGEEEGQRLFRRYGHAFPAGYRETFDPEVAVADIELLETARSEGLAVNLYRPVEAAETTLRFKVCRPEAPVALSDALPLLENMGLRVIAETPHRIRPAAAGAAGPDGTAAELWLHDFELAAASGQAVDLHAVKPDFEDAFRQLWHGELENDGFNRLVLAARLGARETVVLRTFARYLRQAGIPFSLAYMEETLAAHAEVAGAIVRLFEASFRPEGPDQAAVAQLEARIAAGLDAVTSLDQDRILRRFLNLVRATLRTNYFQRDQHGAPKPYLSIKLDSRLVDELPLPRPLYEIFVYSPRMEGIHLRGGKVARGGIRWSDRREDFRTEILGLMKAQMVKNAVIVPVGSKGGFVVKRPPADPGRDAQQAEAVECYRTLLRGMLDITDNHAGNRIAPPPDVWRRDDDDPYLVVAADKGTATFSDYANAISAEYGFWLGDAFASGGSAGYDHKGMGITARGAWEAVKRHFRELGTDIQRTDFTVVGIGDMSGDVFGNGMLRSRHVRLIGAFDHRHVFIDPEPDAERSFAERERLFHLPRSSWADYDPSLISAGGGVFPRTAKSVPLTPEIRGRLGLEGEHATPVELIRALLKAEVDLLYLGGIGTYIKASDETDAEVGDRANDAIRIDGRELRCRVVGEGANLGVTQRGRIEYALAGGRIDTDFIDNSAGVDTSDHEVNLKVLLARVEADGDITRKQRDQLLRAMTDEVATLVIRDNYQQTLALSVAEDTAAALLSQHVRLIRNLERTGHLNRAVEFLPDEPELAARATARRGLTRPELAVLLAYAKMTLYQTILPTDVPDDPALADFLVLYFPEAIRSRFAGRIGQHQLRREIGCTQLVNSLVNRGGIAFVQDLVERTGQPPHEVARAFAAARAIFELPTLWREIEALDAVVDADEQTRMIEASRRLLTRAARWLLGLGTPPLDVGGAIAKFQDGVARFQAALEGILTGDAAQGLAERGAALAAAGVPEPLAVRVAALEPLGMALDAVRIAGEIGASVEDAARTYFSLGERLHVERLRRLAGRVAPASAWDALALAATLDELDAHQARIAAAVGATGERGVDAWVARHRSAAERLDRLVADMESAERPELAMLTVAAGTLRMLAAG